MYRIAAATLALALAACATQDAQGKITLPERSEALGNLSTLMRSGHATIPVYVGPCNAADITGCTSRSQMDREQIVAAWRSGKLFVESPDGKVTQVPASAKYEE